MLLSLTNGGTASHRQARYHRLLGDIARYDGDADPIVVLARRAPLPGYDLSYEVTMARWSPPRRSVLHVLLDAKGAPSEFVECVASTPSPACEFILHMPERPNLEIRYSVSMELWEQRDEVRIAVQALIQSFLVQPDR
ncbi:MAG TPA: hypothetical protein VN329_03980 [Roseomonas sp.]|nr:hypothetical protein [Roseomonas sp.]